MIVMDMEHATMANVIAISDTLVYHAIVIWIELYLFFFFNSNIVHTFIELQKLLAPKCAVRMVFAYWTNVFVKLDTVDQIAQFKVSFLKKGCVKYCLFFTFLEPKCPEDCNNNGVCQNGICKCHDGYSGVNCEEEVKLMDEECNGHGTFNILTRKCDCFEDYGGLQCESNVTKCKKYLQSHL